MPGSAPLDRLPALNALPSHRSLSDSVHDALRDAITQGVIGPGTRLPEVLIARQLNVSPTPVREALRRLAEEGLVQTLPHRGAIVVLCTRADLANLYEIHEVLESHAVAQAALRVAADPDATAPLLMSSRAILDDLDLAVPNPDQTAFNRLDLEFHRSLNALGGNDLLTDEITQLHRRIQSARIRFDVRLPDRPARSQEEHRVLLDAVTSGDPATAREAARAHVHVIRDQVMRLLEEGESATTGDETERS